ncbi:MAG: hypothetical protein HY966_05005, partial [Ignavibacteriales bacterium]|nr:hypothetical protein [Ignavibacteriales bacterium]
MRAVIFFSSVLISSALSQQQPVDSMRIYKQPEVVITATRLEQPLHEVGRSVTVISNEQIKSNVAQSLADVLSLLKGISIIGGRQT